MFLCEHRASLRIIDCLVIKKVYFAVKGIYLMVTREEIVAEIQKVPEKHLEELYRVIKDFEAKSDGEDGPEQSAMAQLRQIKISASPDFSIKANLYDIEDKDA